MEQISETIISMLNLMDSPAFCVKNGIIAYVNHSASYRMIEQGQPLAPLLVTGITEYANFTEGSIFLTLKISGEICGVSVARIDDADIFIMETDSDQAELQAMALASQELRGPLSSIMLMADRLFPAMNLESNPAAQDQAARINRGLYQMLRIVSNMSDASRYCTTPAHFECREVNSFVKEIFDQIQDLSSCTGITVDFTGLTAPVYTQVDPEKLERAIYNIISNAIKFTPKGGKIAVILTRRQNYLYLCVEDSGSGIAQDLRSSIFSRFRRSASIEESRYGIGLGMVLIRAAAAAHGGVVLVEQPESGGTRVTITIKIRENKSGNLRSPILQVDYAGERNHGLLEMSDSLPPFVYEKDKIN